MTDPIAAYALTHPAEQRSICDQLQSEIAKALPKATSKIWHGSPVWFLDDNPVVGYTAKKQSVELLFWSGQLFDEPLLAPMGKDKAARITFQHESAIRPPDLRRWLKKSRTIVFDYAAFYAQKRAAAKKKSAKRS